MARRSTWTTLPNWEFRLLPRDNRTLITCVFLGLIMAVILQIAERLDVAIAGGTVPIVSSIVVCAIWVPSAAFYGFTGALITAWINPIISNLTASQPMAPFFFLTNAAHTLPVVLLVWLMKRAGRGLNLWQMLVIGQIAGLADAVVFGIGNRLIMQMPWDFIVGQILVLQPCYVAGSFITYVIMHRLLKTGLIRGARTAPATAGEV